MFREAFLPDIPSGPIPPSYLPGASDDPIPPRTAQLLKDQYILVLGDSVDRYALFAFCDAFNTTAELAKDWLAAPSHFNIDFLGHPEAKTTDVKALPSMEEKSWTCRIERLNCTMFLLMTFGASFEHEKSFRHLQLPKPDLMRPRLQYLVDLFAVRSLVPTKLILASGQVSHLPRTKCA